MSMTRDEFVANVRQYMDAESSTRWTEPLILAVGGTVCQTEWSEILAQNQYYRCATRTVTTDSQGRVAIADLTTGSGDSTEYFYRLLTGFTDGYTLYTQTDLEYVPLATQTNYQSPFQNLFYLAGDYFQLLPVQSSITLTVQVNHTPPTVAELSSGSSTITIPRGYEWVLVWVTAATLLLKGAAESAAASDLFSLAESARLSNLADLARLTTRRTTPIFQDSAGEWGGGS